MDWVAKYEIVGVQAIKDAGYIVNASGLPMQRCVKCGEVKERTTDFFSAGTVGANLDTWFSKLFPSLRNGPKTPCNMCFAKISLSRVRDIEGDGWLRSLLTPYKLPIEWGKWFYTLPPGVERCWATGGTLPFQKGSNSFSLSVNSKAIQTVGAYSQTRAHAMEDVVPVYFFANCRQTVGGPNKTKVIVIPSLREAFAELYRRMNEAFQAGRAAMEARGDEQAMNMNAWTDFMVMTRNAMIYDKKRDLENDMSRDRLLDMVAEQHAICSTTGIVMTSITTSGGVRGPFDVHMDRINDGCSLEPAGHVATNIELKCRLFNSEHNVTRKDFLLLFLNQVLVPVPENVRQLAQAEYDAIPCSPRDAWKHSASNEDAHMLEVLRHVQAAKTRRDTAWFSAIADDVLGNFPGKPRAYPYVYVHMQSLSSVQTSYTLAYGRYAVPPLGGTTGRDEAYTRRRPYFSHQRAAGEPARHGLHAEWSMRAGVRGH